MLCAGDTENSKQPEFYVEPEDVPLCPIVTNYRTFVDDMYKVLEFVEWYKEWY